MHGHNTKQTWILGTHNDGKRQEFNDILATHSIEFILAPQVPPPDETGLTFHENALIKAEAFSKATNMPALADDSGLAVAALNGAPGIYTARWADPDYATAFARLKHELKDHPHPVAAFVCVLCLFIPGKGHHFFEGRLEGTLVFPPRGIHGFGYDPIFVPQGDTRTCAEMPPEEKHKISHRGRAIQALIAKLPELT